MKRVLITGGSLGIGQATAEHFSKKNYEVLLLARHEENLKKVSDALPGPSSYFCVDLCDEKSLLDFSKNQKPIDTLINNAGIFHTNSFLKTEISVWKDQFLVNLLAPVVLLKNLKILESVVNVSSSCALSTVAHTSAYSSMKKALISLTEHLAFEWAPSVRVNCICPGVVDTPIHDFHDKSEEEKKPVHKMHPLGRMGKPQEVAETIFFLATTPWMTGSVLSFDGGIRLGVQPDCESQSL